MYQPSQTETARGVGHQDPARNLDSVRLPPEPSPEQCEQARERAFERLFELRVSQRAASDASRLMSKRDVLVAFRSGVAAAITWGLLGRSASPAALGQDDDAARGQELFRLQEAGRFAWETLLFQCGQLAFGQMCIALKLPIGNAAVKSQAVTKSSIIRTIEAFERDPALAVKLYGSVGILGPALEEGLFRILPSKLINRQEMQWSVGIPSSLAFAALHNIIREGQPANTAIQLTDRTLFSLDMVPLPQFLLGAFCWYAMKRYGDLAPILAHTFNNQALALSVVWGGRETAADFKRLFQEELALQQRRQRIESSED